jgi:hypothetical protein
MQIRAYQESDLDALRAIHAAQCFDYALPDLSNPLFVTKLLLVDDEASPCSGAASSTTTGESASPFSPAQTEREAPPGRILGAALLRLTAEAYLLLDPNHGTPRQRWLSLLALHEATKQDAWQRGLEDVHAWLPPPIASKFGRRLARLGWQRDDTWTPYCHKLSSPPER